MFGIAEAAPHALEEFLRFGGQVDGLGQLPGAISSTTGKAIGCRRLAVRRRPGVCRDALLAVGRSGPGCPLVG
jgi:hypothetical protein